MFRWFLDLFAFAIVALFLLVLTHSCGMWGS